MSGPRPHRGAPARLPRLGSRRALVVSGASAATALGLGGHGLLVPAGPATASIRVAGAVVALGALAILVRLDGPAQGSRTLALVAVVGALTGLATLPASPVTLDDVRPLPPPPAERADPSPGELWLERARPPGGDGVTLVVPPGGFPEVHEGTVVARMPDGGSVVLGPADDGAVLEQEDGSVIVVAGGVLLEVPEPLPAARPPGGVDPLDDRLELLLALLLGAFALLAFAPPVVRVASRAVPGPEAVVDAAASPPCPGSVEDGLAEVLRSMLADPDPRTAVIGAYARLLVALESAGVARRPEEGPHEHLWRVLGPLGVRRTPVHRLAELFVRARFSPHPITDVHREAAIACLADALADLRLDRHEAEIAGLAGRAEAAR
jgi:hypothetical protein